MTEHHITERFPTGYLDQCTVTELTGTHLFTASGPRPEYHLCSRELHSDGRHACRACGHTWTTGQPLTWLPRTLEYIEWFGIDPAMVEDAIEHPLKLQREPANENRHYDLMRYRRGDLEVCVGLADPDRPCITYVRVHLPRDGRGHRCGGSVGGRTAPTTVAELEDRVRAAGYRPVPGGKHTRVLRPDGTMIATLVCTSSDARSLTNAWKQFERAAANDAATRHAS